MRGKGLDRGEAWHGTWQPDFLDGPVPPANECHLFTRVDWHKHDSWMSGGPHLEEGIPYANIIWEALGLRDRDRRDAPEWAKGIRSFRELGEKVGMFFVTDRPEDAGRYGTSVIPIDLDAEQVLDVIGDPHVRTHNGWIVLVKAGEAFPVKNAPAPSP